MFQTIAEFSVENEKIKLQLGQLPQGNGRIWRGINIRKFFTSKEGQDVPMKHKGIVIPLSLWPEFIEAIEEVSERLNKTDWLEAAGN